MPEGYAYHLAGRDRCCIWQYCRIWLCLLCRMLVLNVRCRSVKTNQSLYPKKIRSPEVVALCVWLKVRKSLTFNNQETQSWKILHL